MYFQTMQILSYSITETIVRESLSLVGSTSTAF